MVKFRSPNRVQAVGQRTKACHFSRTTDPGMVKAGLALQLRGGRLRVQVTLLQQECNIIPNLSTYNENACFQIGRRTHRGRGYGETSTWPIFTLLGKE